jgi:hypothetical protein
MMTNCTRCSNSGFLNLNQITDVITAGNEKILEWIEDHPGTDVQVCDCCGDGETWYGDPGWHYGKEDPPGDNGPYTYNGGLCECN